MAMDTGADYTPELISQLENAVDDPMAPVQSSLYSSNIKDSVGQIDSVACEEITAEHVGLDSHPRMIITFNNGYDYLRKKDYKLSFLFLSSVLEMIKKNQLFDPLTNQAFSPNQIKRINWYKLCLEMFPDVTYKSVSDYKKIIDDWLVSPLEETLATNMARFFVTYDQIIDYYGFTDVNSREKAEVYFSEHPDKTWVIRKSSIKDTKYNQFFVLMIKHKIEDVDQVKYNNHLYLHRQGYGICDVDASRHSDMSSVTFGSQYYTNIVDLLIFMNRTNVIKL